MKELFKKWSSCLFVGFLPYQTILRILDCLFYEGSTILYRIAVGILEKNEDALLTCENEEQFIWILNESMKNELLADDLFEFAWKIKIKHENLVVHYNTIVDEGYLIEIPEFEMDVMKLPNPIGTSKIVTLKHVIFSFFLFIFNY